MPFETAEQSNKPDLIDNDNDNPIDKSLTSTSLIEEKQEKAVEVQVIGEEDESTPTTPETIKVCWILPEGKGTELQHNAKHYKLKPAKPENLKRYIESEGLIKYIPQLPLFFGMQCELWAKPENSKGTINVAATYFSAELKDGYAKHIITGNAIVTYNSLKGDIDAEHVRVMAHFIMEVMNIYDNGNMEGLQRARKNWPKFFNSIIAGNKGDIDKDGRICFSDGTYDTEND